MNFKKNILSLYGHKGQLWLDNLPTLVNQCAAKWDLTELQPLDNLSFNYVLAGMQKNLPIILKLGFDKSDLQKEIDALLYFAGHGCVKILNHDIGTGALLLERAIPGQTLKSFFPEHDAQATQIACRLIQNLHSITVIPDPKKFSQLSDWVTILDKQLSIPESYLHKAQALSAQLLATTTKTILLHGDLHHDNILSSGPDTWVAIDPKGVMGDPVYEIVSFMCNPKPETFSVHNMKDIFQNRSTVFADYFGFDRQRILDWAYVQSILSACWSKEDGLAFEANLALADIIEHISQTLTPTP